MPDTNEHTGKRLTTPAASKEYLENYDIIFSKSRLKRETVQRGENFDLFEHLEEEKIFKE